MKESTIERIKALGLSPKDFEENNPNAEIEELKRQNEMLIECILEMADIIYA